MRVPSSQRGVTLIELMLVLGVSGIVIGVVAQVLYFQQRSFLDQLEYGEAQQNARASIALLKRYVRMAGWGMTTDPSAQGTFPIGACYKTGDTANTQTNCDNIDTDIAGGDGMDRLRVVYIQPDGGGALVNQPHQVLPGDIPAGLQMDPNPPNAALSPPPGHPLLGGYAVISGPCIGGGFGSDLVALGSASTDPTYYHRYDFTQVSTGTVSFSCVNGYDNGVSFGRAVVADFFVDVSDPVVPTLRVRLDPSQDLADSHVVAHDIEDLQVSYLLDITCKEYVDTGLPSTDCPTETTPDRIWDEVCDNPNSINGGEGGCISTQAATLTAEERLQRIVAVQIGIVARSKSTDARRYKPGGTTMQLMNHTYTWTPASGQTNGDYRRWIYRTTVAVRNRGL